MTDKQQAEQEKQQAKAEKSTQRSEDELAKVDERQARASGGQSDGGSLPQTEPISSDPELQAIHDTENQLRQEETERRGNSEREGV